MFLVHRHYYRILKKQVFIIIIIIIAFVTSHMLVSRVGQ